MDYYFLDKVSWEHSPSLYYAAAYLGREALFRVTAVNESGILRDVHLSGDFFFYPAENLSKLEKALSGIPAQSEAIIQAVEPPGVHPADFARVLIPV